MYSTMAVRVQVLNDTCENNLEFTYILNDTRVIVYYHNKNYVFTDSCRAN